MAAPGERSPSPHGTSQYAQDFYPSRRKSIIQCMRTSRNFETVINGPLPPLAPYQRCKCGRCQECRNNVKWDQVFAKFEVKQEDNWPTKGFFQSTLRGW